MIPNPISSRSRQSGMINLGGIGVVLFLIWCFWVAMGATAHVKLERVCSPVSVTGNLMVSLAALAWEPSMSPTKKVFDQATYGCQYMAWRLVYERKYKEWLEEQRQLGNNPPENPWAQPPEESEPPAESAEEDTQEEA